MFLYYKRMNKVKVQNKSKHNMIMYFLFIFICKWFENDFNIYKYFLILTFITNKMQKRNKLINNALFSCMY